MIRGFNICCKFPQKPQKYLPLFEKRKFLRVIRASKFLNGYPNGKLAGSSTYCTNSNNVLSKRLTITNSHPGLLEAMFYGVETYGKLKVDVPFDIHVEPLDIDKFPEMNKLFIRLIYDDTRNADVDSNALSALRHLYSFDVEHSKNEVFVKGKFKSNLEYPLLCHLQVPLKFDLDITAGGQRTHVQNLECGSVAISAKSATSLSESSSCYISKIKCGHVKVNCEKGDIVSKKLLQGNLELKVTGEGNITADRLQGSDIKCETNHGDISATSVYGQNCHFHSNKGNIKLSNFHSEANIQLINGNLTLDALEGKLAAEIDKGSADFYVTRPDDIKVKVNSGDISLKVLEAVKSTLDLTGTSVDICDSIKLQQEQRAQKDLCNVKGFINGTEGRIKAEALDGKVSLKTQDWFSSLKLSGN